MTQGATTTSTVAGVLFRNRRFPVRARLCAGIVGPAPLADIVLLIVFFVLLNSWFVLRPGVALDLPVAGFNAGAPMGSLIVSVPRENMILFNDERLSIHQLGDRFRESVSKLDHPTPLLIEADRHISFETLMSIYQLAQRAGFEKVYLATRPPRPHTEEGL